MTLVAAFRTNFDGILLCADCQEDDGISKKVVNKIERIRLRECEIFLAGAGYSAPVKDAEIGIAEMLQNHENNGQSVLADYRGIIEANLKAVHKKHAKILRSYPMNLIVVVASRVPNTVPMLYHSVEETLIPEVEYVAHGSGQAVSDYIAARLYDRGLLKHFLILLVLFILRESGYSSTGVGFGGDMVIIHPGGRLQYLWHQVLAEFENQIPQLADSIWDGWIDKFEFPKTWID